MMWNISKPGSCRYMVKNFHLRLLSRETVASVVGKEYP